MSDEFSTNYSETESPAITNAEPQKFIDTLDEDLRGLSNLNNFENVNQLARSYIEKEKMLGRSFRLPPEDASPEARQEFYKKIRDIEGVAIKGDEDFYSKIGRPESYDKYQLDDMASDEFKSKYAADIENFKKAAFNIGLTNEQARKAAEENIRLINEQEQSLETTRSKVEEELRNAWGFNYEARLKDVGQAVRILRNKYGEGIENLINSEAGNNPVFIRMLSEMAGIYKEKNHVGSSGIQFSLSPEDAMQKIADKRADKGFMKAYTDSMDPGHKKAVEDLSKLYSIAKGDN